MEIVVTSSHNIGDTVLALTYNYRSKAPLVKGVVVGITFSEGNKACSYQVRMKNDDVVTIYTGEIINTLEDIDRLLGEDLV